MVKDQHSWLFHATSKAHLEGCSWSTIFTGCYSAVCQSYSKADRSYWICFCHAISSFLLWAYTHSSRWKHFSSEYWLTSTHCSQWPQISCQGYPSITRSISWMPILCVEWPFAVHSFGSYPISCDKRSSTNRSIS